MNKNQSIAIKGSIILSFKNICINLNYIADKKILMKLENVSDPSAWYSLAIFDDLFKLIVNSYEDSDIILELLGQETMKIWYEEMNKSDRYRSGSKFLKYQSGSQGYLSMVKGPKNLIGGFSLEKIDTENGLAIINDTTPFHPSFSKGIIYGGMKAPGDILRVDIQKDSENRFTIVYQSAE